VPFPPPVQDRTHGSGPGSPGSYLKIHGRRPRPDILLPGESAPHRRDDRPAQEPAGKYQAVYANSFSEGSHIQNEQGFYTGINFFPTKNWIVKAYVDFYEFPWLRYQVSKPSTGLDYFVVAEYALSSNFNFYFRYKDETKLKDISSENDYVKQQKKVNNKQLRLHFNYGDREQFHFKTRLQWSWYEHLEKEKGFLAYQDIVYTWQSIPLKSTVRFLIFDTDGYNSRIYTYENDLLYSYAIPSFANRGIRSYILLKYELIKLQQL